jgi:uncharacterized protein (TIGR00369 family)
MGKGQSMATEANVPEGFKQVERGGPFLRSLGPVFLKKEGDQTIVGFRIEERHLNTRGIAHGGMLVTLADSALGIVLALSLTPPQPMVTVNLTADFADSAHLGDWVEAHVDIQKVGIRLAFANCYLRVGDRRILRASGVFARMPPLRPKESFEG